MMTVTEIRKYTDKYLELKRNQYEALNECIRKYGRTDAKDKMKRKIEKEYNSMHSFTTEQKEMLFRKEFNLPEEPILQIPVEGVEDPRLREMNVK